MNLLNAETVILHDFSCRLNKQLGILKKVCEAFRDFRKWIYESVVIDKLLVYTNNIIKMVINDDSLTLKCNLEGDISEKTGYLNWKICHDKSVVNYKKISASQGAILGFAIRMALVLLGTSKIFSDQLFMDESFISLDKDKIKQIPTLINNMSSIFKTVVIVSHLDIIKEACNKNVYIQRVDGKSFLRYDEKCL
jgi:DNA repair exonuclease SbcCD ATPase subunit